MNAADGKLLAARLDGESIAAPAHTPEPWGALQEVRAILDHSRLVVEGLAPANANLSDALNDFVAPTRAFRPGGPIEAVVNELERLGISDPAAVRALVEAARALEANHLTWDAETGEPEFFAISLDGTSYLEQRLLALYRALAAFPESAK